MRWNSFQCEGSLCFFSPSDVWALEVLRASFCCRKLYPCWLTWGAAVCSQIRLCLCLPPWQWTKAYGFTSPKSVCVHVCACVCLYSSIMFRTYQSSGLNKQLDEVHFPNLRYKYLIAAHQSPGFTDSLIHLPLLQNHVGFLVFANVNTTVRRY